MFDLLKVEYLVKWKDTWMRGDDLNCPNEIHEFDSIDRNHKQQYDENLRENLKQMVCCKNQFAI